MRILSVDTASTTGSVAVVEGGALLSEITVARRETHSRHVMDMVDTALKMAGLALHEVDGFAYTQGPGSFTGLRIGLSVVKGLAFTAGKPLAGVSSLEVLAYQLSEGDRLICPMMDARNKEVYCARYRWIDGGLRQVAGEKALTPEESVAGIDAPCVLVGEGAERYRSIFETRLGKLVRFARPMDGIARAAFVAYLGMFRFQTQQTDDLRTIAPVYLRKAYAETAPFIDRGV